MAHVRKLKNHEGSKIYVKVRLLRILFQRGFQKSTILLELREYEPTTPLPLSSSKFNRGVRQMFEDMEISVK